MGMVRGDLKLFFKQWTFLSNSLVDKISCKLFETVVLLAPVRNLILAGGGGGVACQNISKQVQSNMP